MKKALFIYIDPGYLSNIGHYKNFTEKIHRSVEKNNIDIIHLVNVEVWQNDIDEFNLFPVFKYNAVINEKEMSYNEIINRLLDFENNICKIFCKIKKLETKYKKVIIFMYTCHIFHIEILLKNYRKYNLNAFMHLVIFYLNDDILKKIKNKSLEISLSSINHFYKKIKRCYIYVDSIRTVRYYQKFFNKEIKLIPIPLHYKNENINIERFKNNHNITISYFGYAEYKYGFHLFYEVYRSLRNNVENISFIVRLNNYHKDLKYNKIIDILKKDKKVYFIDYYINNFFYKKLFFKSDIVIIPYLQKYYSVQTSGVFIDALWNNKFIIAPEDTWMADMIKYYGKGLTFKNNDAKSLIEKIIFAIRTNIFKKAKTKDILIRDFFTVEKFFEVIKGEI